MACSATARFGMNEICCVTVDVEAHVSSVEPDTGVRSHGCVVHQHPCSIDGVSGVRSLLGANFVKRNDHGGVDGARDVEKRANDALHACDVAFLKFRCSCGFGRVLHLGPIRRCDPFVGRVLRARGYRVLEVAQGFTGGVGHGDVNVVFWVVPTDG